jgi:hypothetical protein
MQNSTKGQTAMFSFNHQRFFTDFSLRTGLQLTAERRKALDFLLTRFENDSKFTMVRELAYVLATIRWETAHTFLPIAEKRASRANSPRLWEIQNRYWPSGFYGRGYVQITWKENYLKAGARLAGQSFMINRSNVVVSGNTFADHPDYVMDPNVAYAICASGMRQGWITGKKLPDFIVEGKPPDYVNARRIINGTDRASDIAAMAGQFELLLRAAS